MSEHSRIAKLIQEIIEACRNDPTRIEVATANFQCLVKVMELYERAPRYFNAALEEADLPFIRPGPPNMEAPDKGGKEMYKVPIVGELEKIFGRHLKHTELQLVGKILSKKTGVKLSRDTKRSKPLLLQWFADHWDLLHTKIYDYELNKMEFNK